MPAMKGELEDKVRDMSEAKAFALASYGESVAAFRYRTLVEKTPSAETRKIFAEMADEEQGHHQRIEQLIQQHFPGSDFVLTAEDKQLVIVGSRMLDVSNPEAFAKALTMMSESERLTGRLYAALHARSTEESIRPFLKEMADECVEHAHRLTNL